jgi:hypothetical protein
MNSFLIFSFNLSQSFQQITIVKWVGKIGSFASFGRGLACGACKCANAGRHKIVLKKVRWIKF